jgi:hypothetical protein
MQKTVTIEIDEAGESSIDLVGFQGKGCADVAKAFQDNDAVTRSEKKREYHVGTTRIEQARPAGR